MLPTAIASMTDGLLISESDYAQRCKKLLALVKRLRASGAQADLDLPRIAVIGNQSAGKSSLVEAISGITVPRDAGTCTRCPMECRMSSSSGTWNCQVSIRWEFGNDGKRMEKVKEIFFGDVITDKAQVEPTLRRAQAAVLNRSVPMTTFLTLSDDELRRIFKDKKYSPLSFSSNAVCIDLSGPELTDLSFVDLPGIIQNAEPETVKFVEDLVKSHIKGNCLILVTLPMSDDIDNQKAARLAREADPRGLRTIGVLTKPDTLPPGSSKMRELWLEVLEDRSSSNRLHHGYFCVRQPDDDERAAGITTTQARAAEEAFFTSTSPWNQSSHRSRFGTYHLVRTLGKLLVQRINDTLPALRTEVVSQLATCSGQLDQLPPAITSDPSSYVLSIITEFCRTVKAAVQGDSKMATLVQKNTRIYAAFKRDIRSTAPLFIPYPSADQMPSSTTNHVNLDFEDDQDDNEHVNNNVPATLSGLKVMYLQDVKRYIREAITRELPNNVPYPAKVSLILDFQGSWENLVQCCFQRVYAEYDATVSVLMTNQFGRYENLIMHVKLAIQELLKNRKDETLRMLHMLLKFETTPFTQNDHYYHEKTAKCLARYRDARAGRVTPLKVTKAQPSGQKTNDAQPYAFSATEGPFPSSSASSFPSGDNLAQLNPAISPSNTPLFGPPSGYTKSFAFGPPAASNAKATQAAGSKSSVAGPPTTSKPLASSFARVATARDWEVVQPTTPTTSFALPETNNGWNMSTPSTSNYATPHPSGFAPTGASEDREAAIKEALAALAKAGFIGLTTDDLGKLNPPDEFEDELNVMAEVHGYFQVSYKRVIDYVPMCIDHLFLYGMADILQGYLIEKLNLGTSKEADRCAWYLAEDPYVEATRKELLAKKDRLESVQLELSTFRL
ncbi:uncharacterized protein FIBRA_00318 [Fibroporia radiculosa]|uniref:GED domain-containing protein n=1 Tax=Fibroporia radiculosa TaxID=599839 RepID=J7S5Z6_9APHY|nr:uncharacterized protein FIBRA_00318 [Fibroporia radiculosa]CCL98324.1 predicted protein [Fibroporia radiculosa]